MDRENLENLDEESLFQIQNTISEIIKERNFKKGDILKAAGYNKPALNSARGNVLDGNYAIQWTGPLYLK